MKKLMKKILAFTLVLMLSLGLAACEQNGKQGGNSDGETQTTLKNIDYKETIKVYNASEYIDMSTIDDFEREFSIKVEYFEFDSNEALYDEIAQNPNAYDIVIPSDYTVDRLIKEGRLEKLDKSKLSNMANVAEEYQNPSYDANNDYVVPYMVGTLGILYNKRLINETVDSWNILFDAKYNGKILMLDSQRDAIAITLKMLGFSMNSSVDAELAQAKTKLQALRTIAAGFNESETIRDKMVAGEGALGLVYSGDAKTAIDRNPDLAYVIPNEGANKWVDGFVIMKNTSHLEAAHQFINFMCRSNIAVRNMTNIGYTSPIKGAWAEFNENRIMFPSSEELERCEAFLYDSHAAQKYTKLWSELGL